MRHMVRGMGLGYGSSGVLGALLFLSCSCALLAIGVFWLGGAVAALGATVALWRHAHGADGYARQ